MQGFKKDFLYYFIGVIIPGLINFVSIPVLKNLIGAERYGIFSILFNVFLILGAAAVSWLNASVIKFKIEYSNERVFQFHICRILIWVCATVSVLSFGVLLFYFHYSFLVSLLFAVALFLLCFHTAGLAFAQANFLSRNSALSDSVRTVVFFIISYVLLHFFVVKYLEVFFLALSISYLSSVILLKNFNKIEIRKLITHQSLPGEFNIPGFIKYGLPLSLWFLCSMLIPFLDKPAIANQFGHSVQGDYQALYDMIFKSITIVFSPILTASFPYMNKYHHDGMYVQLSKFLIKLLLIEFGVVIVLIFGYFMFSGVLLNTVLHISADFNFKLTGLLIIIAAFLWQAAMLFHKPFELEKKTHIMLFNNIIALFVSIVVLIILQKSNTQLMYYPLVFIAGSITYIILCIYRGRNIFFKYK